MRVVLTDEMMRESHFEMFWSCSKESDAPMRNSELVEVERTEGTVKAKIDTSGDEWVKENGKRWRTVFLSCFATGDVKVCFM